MEMLHTLYPFIGKSDAFLRTPLGPKMHYVDEGQGEAILMVHGNPTWSFFYRNLILELSAQYRCIAPDHIGCGLSDKPQDYPYRLQTHIDNLAHLVQHLNLKKFHLIVHDWGGPIGLAVAQKFLGKVDRIVILNTSAFLPQKPPPRRIRICKTPLMGDFLVRGLNGFARAATWMTITKKLKPEIKWGYLYPYSNWQNRIGILRFVQDIPLKPSHPSFNTLKTIDHNLHKLKDHPTTLLWGERDFCFTPYYLQQWQHRLPNATVHRFPNAGHYLLEDAKDSINAKIGQFLETV